MSSNQPVNDSVLTEFLDPRSEHNQFSAVGQSHSRTIDRFVAQPGALVLFWIQIDHNLREWLLQHFEVDSEAQGRGFPETFRVIPDIDAARYQLPVEVAGDNGEHIYDWQVRQKSIRGVVEDAAHRGIHSAHDSLHSINGAEIMAAIDAVWAPRSHEYVLIVICHADYFVRHNLS